MSQPKLIAVRFLKPWNGYNADEVAGFTQDKVESLVKAKVALLNSSDSPEPEEPNSASETEPEKPPKVSKDKPSDPVSTDEFEKP